MIKTMMERIQRKERNPQRFVSFGGEYFKWSDKTSIQRMITLMVSYINQLEDANKELVNKNNELIQKNAPVPTIVPIPEVTC